MTQTTQTHDHQKSRKIRALAAGGAVLGLGAAITLAAWSDSEFADGLFTTQDFGIQAANSFASPVWGDHVTEDEALSLVFNGAEQMYPGQTIVAPYQIKNRDGGADSVVTFTNEEITATSGGTEIVEGNHLSAAIYEVDADQDCSINLDALTPMVETGSFELTDQEPQRLCVAVTLDEAFSVNSSQTAEITWEFTATHPEASTTP